MPDAQITVGDYSTLKFMLMVTIAVVLGLVIYHWGTDETQKLRRKYYLKTHPGTLVQAQPMAQISSDTHPEISMPITAPGLPPFSPGGGATAL